MDEIFNPCSNSRGWRVRAIAKMDQGGECVRECLSEMTVDDYAEVVRVLNKNDHDNLYREDPDCIEVIFAMARHGLTTAIVAAIDCGDIAKDPDAGEGESE